MMAIRNSFNSLHIMMLQFITLLGLAATGCCVPVSTSPRHPNTLYKELYPTFKALENALVSNPEQLHLLRQTFFPVVTNRFWSVDGVEVVRIITCLQFGNGKNYSTSDEDTSSRDRCWMFQWTNSQLMSIISADQLLAMDPVLFIALYSDVVGSLYLGRSLEIRLRVLSAEVPSDNDILQSLALLLSWAKVYSMANGVPNHWDSQYQGYVTKWYAYTANESLFKPIITNDKYVYIALWATFTVLNLLIPLLFCRRGVKMSKIVTRASHSCRRVYPAIVQAAVCLIILWNTAYLILMVCSHVYGGQPTLLTCLLSTTRHHCSVPSSASFNTIVLGVLITKVVLFAIGTLFELVAALKITRHAYPLQWKQGKFHRLVRFLGRVFVTWHCLVFVHIMLGLLSIPLTVGFIICPAHTILTAGSVLTVIVILLVALASVIHTKPWNVKFCRENFCSLLENLLLIALLGAVFFTYFTVMKGGVNMSTMKGLLLALLPTVPLPVLTWVVRRRLQQQDPPEANQNERSDHVTATRPWPLTAAASKGTLAFSPFPNLTESN